MTAPRQHTVIDVEAVLDPNVPPKEGAPADRFEPPIRWQVVSLGFFAFANYIPETFGCVRGATEREKIASYARHLEDVHPILVTWNGRNFDTPVLGLRALRYGIPMPWWYGSARGPRYRYTDKAIDVKDALSDFGAAQTASLNQAARLIGWPGKGEISGEDVARLHAEKNIAAIERYCLEDVAHLAAVWLRYELLRGNIGPRDWRRVATTLLDFLSRQSCAAPIVAKVDRSVFIDGGTSQLTLPT